MKLINKTLRAAEFFAGAGLVRAALEAEGFNVAYANDISIDKATLYRANYGSSELHLGDIAEVPGSEVPDVDIATVSFPCTDLSLAGNGAGIHGGDSGMFWEFVRVMGEMGDRRPGAVLIENVNGLGSRSGGENLAAVIRSMNELGYWVDILSVDARLFLPQSRPRLFLVALDREINSAAVDFDTLARPKWLSDFIARYPGLRLQTAALRPLPSQSGSLSDIVDRGSIANTSWWDEDRLEKFIRELSDSHTVRLNSLKSMKRSAWVAAYRRTRNGTPKWELRSDSIAGCLRGTQGGSSRQAIVRAGRGIVQARWMTAREYARLQGAIRYRIGSTTASKARHAFGDAVCVPVVRWILREYIHRFFNGMIFQTSESASSPS